MQVVNAVAFILNVLALSNGQPPYISILGDPGLQFAPDGPRVMLEAWNFCNRAGHDSPPTLPSPRYADCIVKKSTCSFGDSKDNCVSVSKNNEAPTSNQDPDTFAVAKEQALGDLCAVPKKAYFWTGMLKNGNYLTNTKECKTPYPPQKPSLLFNNLPMNQPRVMHRYTNMKNNSYGIFEGTWDLNASSASNTSYFSLEWFIDPVRKTPVFRNKIRTSPKYPWLMLYTGVDIGRGEKGGVQYKGRGMMNIAPSTPDFLVEFWLNVRKALPQNSPHSSFYFLNMGSCWKNDGRPCDGDTTTDVTRYVLMETNPKYHKSCSPKSPMRCPRYHTFINGTVVSRSDPSYPFGAYKEWCAPPQCGHLLPGESTCDPYSNPMQQDILKLAPHPEWEHHGFPAKAGDGFTGSPKYWTLNVGALLNRIFFACAKPKVTNWTTLNIGPEAGIGTWQGYPVEFEWDIAQFDVKVVQN